MSKLCHNRGTSSAVATLCLCLNTGALKIKAAEGLKGFDIPNVTGSADQVKNLSRSSYL
jgi:hypothetical protein